MAHIVLPVLLRARYGRHTDRLERIAEFSFLITMLVIIGSPDISTILWPYALASGTAMIAITVQTLVSHWQVWASPPIATPRWMLYRDFSLACLISGPGLLTTLYAIFSKNFIVLLPTLIIVVLLPIIYSQFSFHRKTRIRHRTPRLSGIGALIELKALRNHIVLHSIAYGILFLGASFLLKTSLAYSLSPSAWFFAGLSFGQVIFLIYQEREDIPSFFLRKITGLPEISGYLYFLLPSLICLIVSIILEKSILFLIPYLFTIGACYTCGKKLRIVPAAHTVSRFKTPGSTPTILLDFLVQIGLLFLWWSITFMCLAATSLFLSR
ncbi:Uncharacterised protein [Corynebacterium kutscheri]|uniref:Uncharacterized protein n=1 Tax=Corynebacterium kutscheri TaxID=35755 RepID=A0AB38VTX0_9CORY|nr:hypothetical protein [Corynebacterium kutscheri]VEH08817.1 Uncharacterised protein [Corynebacterium kutscheri]VEH79946.1 Uncharacterised protein [Corynebacterium kutscheri]